METRGIEGFMKGVRYYIYGVIITILLTFIFLPLFKRRCTGLGCIGLPIIPLYTTLFFSILFWVIYPYKVMNKNCGKSGNVLYMLILGYVVIFIISNKIIDHVYAPKKQEETVMEEEQENVYSYTELIQYNKASKTININILGIYLIMLMTYMIYYKCK